MLLLTGVTGFIGSHLLGALTKEYGSDEILSLTSKPLKNGRFLLHDNYTFKGDIFVQAGSNNL